MRHGTRQLSGERARHGASRPATGLVLRRHVAGFCSAVDSRDIDYETDLFEVFEDHIVPSGVAELSYLQAQGYTYVKP